MHHYQLSVYLAMFGWVPLVLCMYALFPPRKALMMGFIGGWLFLPVAVEKFSSIPAYSKLTVASYACSLGTLLFAPRLLLSFRPRWFDLPMLIVCLSPFVTSLNNDLGYYDGGSAVVEKIVIWGIPYVLGRIYFPDWESITELARAIVIGTLIYAPLCFFEMRFSPQLHRWIYGYHASEFAMTLRMGGYRPVVFLQHGLAVSMWMTGGALVGLWLWMAGTFKRIWGIPMIVVVPILLASAVMCRSLGGMLFFFAGTGAMLWMRFLKNPLPLVVLILAAPAYMYVRTSGYVTGEYALIKAEELFGTARAKSLMTRVHAENLLGEKAMEQPWFGWGRFGRNRMKTASGKDAAVTDGLWIITLGTCGVVGLSALTISILLPTILVWWRCPTNYWFHPGVAATASIAVLLTLHMSDNLLNAMLDPVFTMATGALIGVMPSIRAQLRRMSRSTNFLPPTAAANPPFGAPSPQPVAAQMGTPVGFHL